MSFRAFSFPQSPHDIREVRIILRAEKIERLRLELFHIFIEQMLFDTVDTKPDISPPVDGIDVEIKHELFLWGKLVEDIN